MEENNDIFLVGGNALVNLAELNAQTVFHNICLEPSI